MNSKQKNSVRRDIEYANIHADMTDDQIRGMCPYKSPTWTAAWLAEGREIRCRLKNERRKEAYAGERADMVLSDADIWPGELVDYDAIRRLIRTLFENELI